ncbi:MAG: hypothetical protein IPM08_09285 [Actinomycetales bacterium]|nr:hypothetical protein [Actinomycetales bacterium]
MAGRVAMNGQAGELLADPRIQQSYLGIAWRAWSQPGSRALPSWGP